MFGLRPENAGLGLGLGLGLETSGLGLGLGLEASGLGLGLVPPGLVNITDSAGHGKRRRRAAACMAGMYADVTAFAEEWKQMLPTPVDVKDVQK